MRGGPRGLGAKSSARRGALEGQGRAEASGSTASYPTKGGKQAKVVVLGGTGRVGSATAAAIVREARRGRDEGDYANYLSGVDVVLAGRRPERAQEVRAAWPDELRDAPFAQCDLEDAAALDRLLADADLVVHAAGPFQQTDRCLVLEAAVRNKTAYIDVCDDVAHTERAKKTLHDKVRARASDRAAIQLPARLNI